MGKFVITTRKNGELQFHLKSDSGHNLLSSEGYNARAGCLNGIESVKKNALLDGHFDPKNSTNGKFYFNLKSSNGQIVGTSDMYADENKRNESIEEVKKDAGSAATEETKPS